jgi:O-antigen/teichoic acid export membrane protein
MPVGVGLVVNGASTYVFFAIASRTLAAAVYSTVSVFWSLLYAMGNGVMQPLEQEVARAVSSRRAKGVGPGPVIRRALLIGAAFWALTSLLIVLFRGHLQTTFHHQDWLIVALILGLAGFCGGHLTRGTLSSHHRFGRYGLFFSMDGLTRVVLAGVLGAIGVAAAGPWGLVMAVTPFVGVAAALWRQHGLVRSGPDAPWAELTQNLGWLLLGTVSISLLVQGGTIAVNRLAGPDQQAAAGQFLNGLQTARIPLFLFQAILASLLPKLSHQAEVGHMDEFVAGLRRLVSSILGLGVIAVMVAALLGPWIVTLVFGQTTQLGRWDLAALAGTFVIIMATICVDQGLVALHAHSRMALGWFGALVTFVAVTAMGSGLDLFVRVELGLLIGAVFGFVWMSAWLRFGVRRHVPGHTIDLSESLAELPVVDS